MTISIANKEFVAIMGPSGSGKSTTMHIMGALDTPTSGKYFLNGKDISNYTDDQLAHIRNQEIGFVFQSFNLTCLERQLLRMSKGLCPTVICFHRKSAESVR